MWAKLPGALCTCCSNLIWKLQFYVHYKNEVIIDFGGLGTIRHVLQGVVMNQRNPDNSVVYIDRGVELYNNATYDFDGRSRCYVIGKDLRDGK